MKSNAARPGPARTGVRISSLSESTPKKVDESWKDTVRKEKETAPETPPAPAAPETDLLSFVSTLGMQALALLEEKNTDLRQAQYLIDVIQMISEKTRGNLTETESDQLNALLYELRMRFVRKTQAGKEAG